MTGGITRVVKLKSAIILLLKPTYQKKPLTPGGKAVCNGAHHGVIHQTRASIKSNSWVIENLVNARSMGGNILLNIGPAPDGTMQPEFYERTAELAKWMAHSKKSLIGADPLKSWKEISNVPVTGKDKEWYLHILPGKQEEIWLKTDLKPIEVPSCFKPMKR